MMGNLTHAKKLKFEKKPKLVGIKQAQKLGKDA